MNCLKNLKNKFKKLKIDSFLVSNYYNIFYLSGFKTLTVNEREAWLLITKKNNYLFTDGRYFQKIQNLKLKSQTYQTEIILKLLTPEKNLFYHIKKIINQEKIKKIGFEAEDLSFLEYQKIKSFLKPFSCQLIPTEKLIIKLREVKDEKEILKIKKACQAATQCLKEITKIIKIGQTEKEIAFHIEFWIKKKGYELAFSPIVAIDENSCLPHYDTQVNGQKKVKKNSLILIDLGVRYKNYCSDITRIIFVNKPNTEKANLYLSLLKDQKETVNYLKKESMAKNIDDFCRKILNFSYPHSTGHGLGLEIHEYPKISKNSNDIIKKNQVFTIEPGIYFEGKFGFRIEDTVFMKEKNKPEILTNFPKEITIIKPD